MEKPLYYEEIERCKTTRARLGKLSLKATSDFGRDVQIETPIFMPVGTTGAMKAVMPLELEETGCKLMLSNTYHLGCQPGSKIVQAAGGVHSFMKWKNAVLTDSGGFQMVSLSKLMNITEDGCTFQSPYQEGDIFLSPERCMEIQHELGSNIIMQLDDVISSTCTDDDRFFEALHRSIRWYDRANKLHVSTGRSEIQNLFPIIQGGLKEDYRRISVREIVARDPPGIAIGGLSGGELKNIFVKTVAISTENLPRDKPRYLMGVGYAIDMLICVGLGCDMFDCVFPTRTARFGSALIGLGKQISLHHQSFLYDHAPVCPDCDCSTCTTTTRSYLSHLFRSKNPVACQLLTIHNLRFQMRFMEFIRQAIREQRFHTFLRDNFVYHFGDNVRDYPDWILKSIRLLKIENLFDEF